MNEIAPITLAVIALTVNLIPFFIALGALFPARAAKTREIAAASPGRAFGIGLVNVLFALVIAFVFFSLAEKTGGAVKVLLGLPALVIVVALAVALSFGLAAVAGLVGERIAPAQSGWKQTLWGTLLLGLGGSVPFLGWFLLLPYAALAGAGAFVIGLLKKN
jgi:hypothetical protein